MVLLLCFFKMGNQKIVVVLCPSKKTISLSLGPFYTRNISATTKVKEWSGDFLDSFEVLSFDLLLSGTTENIETTMWIDYTFVVRKYYDDDDGEGTKKHFTVFRNAERTGGETYLLSGTH